MEREMTTPELTIHRGSHQIGGCCTEIASGGEIILIDLGANLPDSDMLISDDALITKVFDGRPTATTTAFTKRY